MTVPEDRQEVTAFVCIGDNSSFLIVNPVRRPATVMDISVAAESARPLGLTTSRVVEYAPAGRPNSTIWAVPFPPAGSITVAVELPTVWPA
ncbi:MAG: hypothetical protein JRN03_07660 [Nitrososphaerota archaeon]|nr:hypothetical protein [Nitrososphaerota archaeon]